MKLNAGMYRICLGFFVVGFSAFRHYHWLNNKDQNLHLEDVNTLVEPRYLAIVYRLVNQIVQSKYSQYTKCIYLYV
jgi:hypothetical protein